MTSCLTAPCERFRASVWTKTRRFRLRRAGGIESRSGQHRNVLAANESAFSGVVGGAGRINLPGRGNLGCEAGLLTDIELCRCDVDRPKGGVGRPWKRTEQQARGG